MDPYCVVEHLATRRSYKTPTNENGGKNPKWFHSIEMPVRSRDDLIKLTIFDENIVNDQIIGSETYTVSQLEGKTNLLSIKYKDKVVGEIKLSGSISESGDKSGLSEGPRNIVEKSQMAVVERDLPEQGSPISSKIT